MGKKLMVLALCIVVVGMTAGTVVAAGDPDLMAWWKLDDGAGAVALDASGHENHGRLEGAAVWVEDPERGMVMSFDGSTGYIDTDVIIPALTPDNSFTWVFWIKQPASQDTNNDTIMGNRYGGTSSPLQFCKFTPTRFEAYNDDGAYENGINYDPFPSDVWVHNAVVKEGAELTYYRDGVVTHTNTMIKTLDENPFYMGADGFGAAAEGWEGYMSDVRLYTRALSAGEVLDAMAGKGPDAEYAGNPVPESEATDIPRDVVLAWTAGEFAATHDVYLGTVFEDVNGASRDNPMDVLASQGQTGTAYAPADVLEYGQTYYWRVDEVNAAPDNTIFAGEVWSFTVEPFTYAVENVTATSDVPSDEGFGLANAVNGSGLIAAGEHSTDSADMWVTATGSSLPVVAEFEFPQVYKLDEMRVWNYNNEFESMLGFGCQDVTVEYSADGAEWTLLGDVVFAQAPDPASSNYTANTAIDFGGAAVKYVRLTIKSNYGPLGQTGLSELQFMYIPVQAREPQPADGAAEVSVVTTLDWRAGREAVSHEVYLGTDPEALDLADTTTGVSYASEALDLATAYYWQIVEVNEAEEISAWPGAVWNFTTEAFLVVDDFESYNDEDNLIFETWEDGWYNDTGAMVGYFEAPFAEQTIVNSGSQSMPLTYENAGVDTSEAELALNQDWTASGIQSLSLSFHGDAANTEGQLYVKINGTQVVYDGPSVNLTRPSWQTWNIDLSTVGANLSSVTSLVIGIEGAGAAGVLYIDDVRLYPEVIESTLPDITGAGDTVQGVPNDDDWPAGEYPALAIDDDSSTKYLHRKGGSETTGFQVEPLVGATIVTGLTFTSANDDYGRDPTSFELYGSNDSIDGPYELIASGEIVDFSQDELWPRYTKTETPIAFENTVAYQYYQVLFPTVDRSNNDGLMQIAEVELLGVVQ